jgi:preprotein translocase subunit SecE
MASATTVPANPGKGPKGPGPKGKAAEEQGSLFRVYKPTQGYWTRLGTGLGVAGIILLTVFWFLREELSKFGELRTNNALLYGILLGALIVLSIVGWWAINRPKHAKFLIETDGEMKKVTWTSRRELVRSTQVVVIFMFLTAAMLFLYDIVFGYLFYFMKVLKVTPLG